MPTPGERSPAVSIVCAQQPVACVVSCIRWANLVDGDWRDQIDVELKWLAGRLGEVRDLDILLARLRNGAEDAIEVMTMGLRWNLSSLRSRLGARRPPGRSTRP